MPILPSLLKTLQYLDGCCCSVAKSCQLFSHPMDCSPTRLLCPWGFPGKNPGVGCHFLFQGIFLTQRLKPSLLHCSQILYHLSYQVRIAQRVANGHIAIQSYKHEHTRPHACQHVDENIRTRQALKSISLRLSQKIHNILGTNEGHPLASVRDSKARK